MIPADFVMLERLPLTPNGKVDRDALPSAELSRRRLDGTYVAPSSPLERYLAEQWSEVLAVRPVGVHDRFFSIGGNSLKAAIMVNRVRDELGEVLEVATVFQYPSIAEMAKHLVERHSGLGGALKSIETGSADAVLGPIEGTAPQPDAPPRLLREMSDDDVRAELERRLARGSERE